MKVEQGEAAEGLEEAASAIRTALESGDELTLWIRLRANEPVVGTATGDSHGAIFRLGEEGFSREFAESTLRRIVNEAGYDVGKAERIHAKDYGLNLFKIPGCAGGNSRYQCDMTIKGVGLLEGLDETAPVESKGLI